MVKFDMWLLSIFYSNKSLLLFNIYIYIYILVRHDVERFVTSERA